MNILLPEYYNSSMGYIIGDTLMINKILNFEKIMYELTYKIYDFRCVYCGKKLTPQTKTLDHLFPRAIGGISITNNLKPCCRSCNSKKGDKTEVQYLDSLKLKKHELKKYNKKQIVWKEAVYKQRGFFLPKEWYTEVDTKDIRGIVNKDYPKGKSYYAALGFYTAFQKFPKPIVIDKDFNLLDGYSILQLANTLNLEEIPAVICENVRF